MSSEVVRELPDLEATAVLAAEIAESLRPGDVLALVGELGAGKTEFTRGLGRALGLPDEGAVCSPSYLLLNLYRGGRLPLAHFDAYFAGEADALERAGLAELRTEGWVVVVEWADRVRSVLPAEALWVELLPGQGGPNSRRALLRRADGPCVPVSKA